MHIVTLGRLQYFYYALHRTVFYTVVQRFMCAVVFCCSLSATVNIGSWEKSNTVHFYDPCAHTFNTYIYKWSLCIYLLVRITCYLQAPLMLRVLILYMSGGSYNRHRIAYFWEAIHGNFIYSKSFRQKFADSKLSKKYFHNFVLIWTRLIIQHNT